jgi:hypothetical protein
LLIDTSFIYFHLALKPFEHVLCGSIGVMLEHIGVYAILHTAVHSRLKGADAGLVGIGESPVRHAEFNVFY